MKRMKSLIYTSAILLALTSMKVMSQSAAEIIDQSMDMITFPSMEMTATLRILDSKGRERIRKINTVSREFGAIGKTKISFIAPPDIKGTAMLIYDYPEKDDDMWIYLPALRKTRRIVSSDKGKSFMGSEFSNADMSKPNPKDFIYNLLGDESIDGQLCWKIESKCRNEEVEDMYGYSRKISWIAKADFLCHRIDYYDFDGSLNKVQTLKNYKKQSNGKYFAFYMKMENKQNKRASILSINQFRSGSTFPEEYYAPSTLDQ